MCLMLVAIPLKGVAAVSPVLCDAQHNALYQFAQVVGSGQAAEHHHDHHPSSSAEKAGQHSSTDDSHQKCSACGSCCVGVAAAPEPNVLVSPVGTEAIFPEPLSRHVGPVLNGLDRPPQFLFA